jgi:hypothetical protein
LTALAERAVACKRWRWMPGMRVQYVWGGPARDRFLCVDKEHAHLVVEDSAVDGGGPLTWLRKRLASFDRDCRPDLDDPATLGCLLALVREAWGDPLLCTSEGHDILSKHWWAVSSTMRRNSDLRPCGLSQVSEAEALIAALESAP